MSATPDMARAQALHERARAAADDLRRLHRELCLLLAQLDAERLYRALGYGSLHDYAQAMLDLAPRTARAMAALGRRLPQLPAVDAAMASGTLSWTKARTLLAVVGPDNEEAWVARAGDLSVRELEAQVAASASGDAPPDAERARELAAMAGRHRVSWLFDDEQQLGLVADAIAVVRAKTGLSSEELSDGSILAELVQRALAAEGTEEAPTAQRAVVALQQCVDCGATAGLDVAAGDTTVAASTCDPLVVDMRPGPARGRQGSAIAPRTRRAALLRDGQRCQNPRCTSRLWLDLHHVDFRCRGGTHDEANVVTLCGACHRALHDGNLGAEHAEEPGVVAFSYLDGEVLRVRLGHGPLDAPRQARGPRGPRRAREFVPSAQELLVFGTRGVRRLAAARD